MVGNNWHSSWVGRIFMTIKNYWVRLFWLTLILDEKTTRTELQYGAKNSNVDTGKGLLMEG
jgi:hypothetical protein